MHNESPGSKPVIRILTDLPSPHKNCFYIKPEDHNNNPVQISLDRNPSDINDPDNIMKPGDLVCFDVQNGIQKAAFWNGRSFRQRGYSYDFYQPLR